MGTGIACTAMVTREFVTMATEHAAEICSAVARRVEKVRDAIGKLKELAGCSIRSCCRLRTVRLGEGIGRLCTVRRALMTWVEGTRVRYASRRAFALYLRHLEQRSIRHWIMFTDRMRQARAVEWMHDWALMKKQLLAWRIGYIHHGK
eukprot:TRINITY_DN6908_c0_g1_i1.p2 TRINITY_DN6908_c0_g1~~TRINITY_DN6908_c0_g1_i1.p2  ORF type:complete len:148 (+),score=6.78 TRINITY_DN6908_c0_g1_i1:504-947(+)